MISKNTAYLPRLDHLRFVAAAIVIAYHFRAPAIAPDSVNPLLLLLREGYSGVTLFMVLSGFILTTICLGRQIDYKAFVVNRLLRIYPLYMVAVFAAVFSGGRQVDLVSFVGLATFMGNLGGVALPKFPHIWTIMVEFQFYLIFPFIVGFFGKKGFPYLLGAIGMMIVLRALLYLADGTVQDAAYWTLLGRFDQFAVGMLVAALYRSRRAFLAHPVWLLLCCAAVPAWLALLTWWCGGMHGPGSPNSASSAWVLGPAIEAAVFGAVVLAYLHQRWHLPAMLDKALAYLGSISYSLYIWHFPMLVALSKSQLKLPLDSPWLNFIFIVMPAIVAVSALSYHIIEQPFFALRSGYIKPAPVTCAPLPPAQAART